MPALLRMVPILWLAACFCLGTPPKDAVALDLEAQRALVNKEVIGVLGDGARGTDFAMIDDLTALLDQGYERRILPMAGAGSVRAIEDLLLLRGVDIAFVQADVLDFYKRVDLFPNIEKRIRYLARLYNKEFHLLASKDIASVQNLEGRRVNFGPASSGSFLTASLVFKALGISVKASDDDYQIALDKLRQGEIDAWVRVDAKPSLQVEAVASDEGLHLLSLPTSAIGEAYDDARLAPTDYPRLIDGDRAIETLAVPTVMAVYAWPERAEKRRQLRRFYDDLTKSIARLQQPPFHEKWREVDLSAEIPGWTRF
ncbi:MAG: TAXI family TRAP transporter solute-binding subunit [Alphaproteobacteria bacterium]